MGLYILFNHEHVQISNGDCRSIPGWGQGFLPFVPHTKGVQLWALLAGEPSAVLITGDRLLLDNPLPDSVIIFPAAWMAGQP